MTALRRLPVPVSEPYAPGARPSPAPVPATQGALALSLPAEAPEAPEKGRDRWAAPQPTPSSALPDPVATCTALVQAVVEVLAGTRPATQLVRWVSADVYAALQRRAALAHRLRRATGPRPAVGVAGRRAVVSGVRICAPADGVVEASAVVLDHGRVRAVAVRLEGLDGRWRATAVEVG